MSNTLKPLYGANNQPLTINVTSLGNNNQAACAAVDNTVSLYQEILVFIQVKTGAAGTSATGTVNVYAYGTADGGTTYSDGLAGTATASGGGTILTSPPNLKLIGVINCVANAHVYDGGPFPLSVPFNNQVPAKWGIVLENKTGAALDATVGSAWFEGLNTSVV